MRLVLMGAGAMLLAGCVTKDYPDVPKLSDYEKQNMTCADLAKEVRRSNEFARQIKAESEINWDTVTGVLLDAGVGNRYQRDVAARDLYFRRKGLAETWRDKNC